MMDREEVINVTKAGNPIWDAKKVGEALDRAIKELSAENSKADEEKVPLIEEAFNAIPSANTQTSGDLISRQDAINAIFKVGHEHIEEKIIPLGAVTDYSDAIRSLPSADRPSGEWKQITPARIYDCSNCGHYVLTDDIEEYNYCPNCGAKMGGEHND